MRKIILFLALGASGFAAAANAQTAPPPPVEAPMRSGPVTRAAYLAQAAARFDRLDMNHDGILDPAERAAGRPMRGMRGEGMPPRQFEPPRDD